MGSWNVRLLVPAVLLFGVCGALLLFSGGSAARPQHEVTDARYREFDELAERLWVADPSSVEQKEALGRLRQRVRVVFDATQSPDPERNRRAMEILAYLRPPGAARALVNLTSAPRSANKMAAWEALHNYVAEEEDPKSLEIVRKRAEYQIRAVEIDPQAVEVLRVIGDPRSIPVLKGAITEATDPVAKQLLKLVIDSIGQSPRVQAGKTASHAG